MKIRIFEKNLLYSVISLGFMIRIYHHYNWRIWGSDSGEYLYLTRHLISNGKMLTDGYIGWGRAYPDFQGMQLLAGSVSLLTQIDYSNSLLWFIPLMSALAIPTLFMIGKKLVGFTPAIFGCAFYSVTFAVVFANSHAMPGGLAETLGFVLLYSWIKGLESDNILRVDQIKRNPWSWIVAISFLALLITHHFTLLLIISGMVGVLIVEIAAGNRKNAESGIMTIGLLSLAISFYWLVYAKSFKKMLDESAFSSVSDSFPVTGILVMIPLLSLIVLWAVKDYLRLPIIKENLTKKKLLQRILIAFAISFTGILLILWKGVPGTIAPLQAGEYQALPYLIVNVLWMSLAVNISLVNAQKNGWLVWGWIVPILSLATIGAISGSHLLIAYRHAPYLLAPLALMSGVGFRYLIIGFEASKRPAIASLFVVLFLGCAIGAYPPPAVMGGFQEGTNEDELDAILWTQFTEKDALVVSDHRLSSLTFGLTETNASWENGDLVITGDTEEAVDAGKSLSTPQAGVKQVSYVMLSEEMQKGVALLQWDPAEELTGKAKTKFTNNEEFPIWFDNGDTSIMRMNHG
tara:strand:- start:1239 stop:2963 length:1725 start_codon:yes stop_codon:yes gene_type:complete